MAIVLRLSCHQGSGRVPAAAPQSMKAWSEAHKQKPRPKRFQICVVKTATTLLACSWRACFRPSGPCPDCGDRNWTWCCRHQKAVCQRLGDFPHHSSALRAESALVWLAQMEDSCQIRKGNQPFALWRQVCWEHLVQKVFSMAVMYPGHRPASHPVDQRRWLARKDLLHLEGPKRAHHTASRRADPKGWPARKALTAQGPAQH